MNYSIVAMAVLIVAAGAAVMKYLYDNWHFGNLVNTISDNDGILWLQYDESSLVHFARLTLSN